MGQEDIDAFLKFADEQSEIHKKSIDIELYDFLLDSAERMASIENSEKEELKSIFKSLDNKAKNLDNLNKITDIYFYEGQFARTSREIQQTILHITTIFASHFKEENFVYLENFLISNKEFKGELALEFYLKIGEETPRTPRILGFIHDNIDKFTDSQKKTTVITFVNTYEVNELIRDIVTKSGVVDLDRIYGGQEEAVDKKEKETKNPWWKFW